MKTILKILLLMLPCLSVGQNLVLNPGFEELTTSSNKICKIEMTNYWSSPSTATPDLFSEKSKKKGFSIPKNIEGYQESLSGKNYAGIGTSMVGSDGYREFIQGVLKSKLIKDKFYLVEFQFSLGDNSQYAESSLGVSFFENKQKVVEFNKVFSGSYDVKTNNKKHLSDKSNWNFFSELYRANGGEEYLIIGNFEDVKEWKSSHRKYNKGDVAYYFIDNVSVTLQEDVIVKDTTPKFVINKNIVLENVFFEFGSSKLKEESLPTLNELFLNLSKIDNLDEIQISGHTDNVGKEEDNLKLSEARAKAVADYLIQQGINKNKINYVGYGSSKSITDNTTEQGREQNRRVEFKILSSH